MYPASPHHGGRNPLEGLLPVALVGGAGLLASTGMLSTWGGIAAVLGAATVSGGLVLAARRRRHRSIDAMREGIARAVAADLPSQIQPSHTLGAPDLDAMPQDLRPLAEAVTELRDRMREQLKEKAKKTRNLESLIDALDEPLLVTDNEDRVLLSSRAAEGILESRGLGASTVRGRPIRDLFTSADVLAMYDAAKGGRTVRGRVRVVTGNAARAFQVSATPLPAAWGDGVFGAVLALRDVTELDQAVQVKTDFVANASHELRTPVAAIRSAAETLETASDDPTMSARLRQMIVSHADRLEEMLRDLLDLSRLESPDVPLKIETVSLAEIERLLRSMSEMARTERDLQISFEIDEEMRLIRTDRKVLTLILRNLVENATKFAHEHTTVRVVGQVIEEQIARPEGTVASTEDGREGVVRFEVIDRGIGIPLAQQERVFERYYQVDAARTGTGSSGGQAGWKRGTGLGLAIVKHAAKALGGRVGLTSVWGQGTTVWVEFPCTLVSVAGAAAPSAASRPA